MNRPLAALCLLGLGLGPATADEPPSPDTSRWACAFCTGPLAWRGWVDIGPGWVSDSALKFADYRGLDDDGGWLSLNGEARYLDGEGRFLDLWWQEPLLDARRMELRGGRQGAWTMQLGWTDIPHYPGQGARTPFGGAGSGDLTLPANWQHAATTSGLSGLAAALQPTALEIQRRELDLGLTLRQTTPWRWRVEAHRSERDGTREFGAGLLTLNTSHLPAPVDHTTDRADLAVDYRGDRGSFQASLGGSWFDNGQQTLSWDNPFTPIGNTERLRAALEPGNRAWNLRLGGGWQLLPSLRLSGRAGMGEASQDEAFAPYSSNPDFEDQPLPRHSLDGRIEAARLDAAGQMNWRLGRGFDVVARLRFEDRDNRTPVSEWYPVITDTYQREATLNRPYSFQREELTLQGRYRANGGWRLAAGTGHKSIERSLQSVHETTETSLWTEAAVGRWESLDLRLRLEAADRDASPYQPFVDPGLPGNPLMRKFNLADRERRQAALHADWSIAPGWSANFSAQHADDDYRHSPLGLQDSESLALNLGASHARDNGLALHAWLGLEQIEARLAGQENFSTNWASRSEDEFLSWGLGAALPLSERWSARLDGYAMHSEGDIDTDGDPFPQLDTELRNLALRFEYDAGRPWAWKLYLEHERYDSDDWQRDGLEPDSIAAVLTLGLDSPDYSVTVARVLGSYRFR